MSSSSSSTKTKDIRHFLTSPSTYWVTLVRLGLILIPSVFSSSNTTSSLEGWLYDGSVLSVLIRPHESLPQLEEAHAVWSLAALKTTTTTKNFSTFYVANHSVRIPPLVLAFFSRWTESGSNFSRICFSLFLLLMDILISYLIEQIGMRLLGLVSSPSRPTNGGDNTTTKDSQQPPPRLQALITEEEDLQRKLPECIRPKYAHIFPIYTSGDACQESAIPLRGLPLISAKLYYWSPFTAIPSSLLCCWQNIPSLFLLASVHESICSPLPGGSVSLISFYLAVATYLEPHHIAYLIPILLLRHFQSQDRNSLSSTATVPSKWDWKTAKPAVVVILFFALWLFLLHGISCSLVGGLENYWSVLGTMYGSTWLTASPNLSLQWYFRMQIFSRFRDYFGAVYAGIPFVLVGPLCLRFYRYPGLLVSELYHRFFA